MLEIVVICMVCCIDQETFDKKHSPVAHTVVKIISQFKAQTLSDRVESVRVGSKIQTRFHLCFVYQRSFLL